MSRPFPGALSGALLLAACQGSGSGREAEDGPTAPEIASSAAPAGPGEEQVAEEATRLIQEGSFEQAREQLDRLLLDEHLTRARAELAAGSPQDALTSIDRLLQLAPDDQTARLLKADASLRLAEEEIRSGGSAGLIEGALQDALEYYRVAPESAHTLFGSSRAAWLLGETDRALDFARRGLALRRAGDPDLGELELVPERLYAELMLAAYSGARAARVEDNSSEGGQALFAETLSALGMLLGRVSDDPWAWSRLADLYEWEGRLADAAGACQRGLLRVPADAGLIERLARVSLEAGGPVAAVNALEAFASANPEVGAGRWHLSVARFQLALQGLKQDPRVLDPAPFTSAEEAFRALGERLPEEAQAALGYQVVCRLARGWCAFHAGDLPRARREFLSMDELMERGIEWALPGELESGIQGLYFVADAYNTREDQLSAGEVFETLHALQPDSVVWANNAGFSLRDAAVDLERQAKNLCRAAKGRLTNAEALAELRALVPLSGVAAGSPEERAAFARAADERAARAHALMERSWQAYRPAAELAPEDVRTVNDAALVLVYYLHHDLDWAEQALLRCVELGGPQIEAKRAALAIEESPERASALDAELTLLTEAWGDAHQNLGVLEWVHRKNGPAARAWLEKALEIWPDRQPVTNSLLPQVRGELAPQADDDPWDYLGWAQPCSIR